EPLFWHGDSIAKDESTSQFNPRSKFRYVYVESFEVLACDNCYNARLLNSRSAGIVQPPKRCSSGHPSGAIGHDVIAPGWHLSEYIRAVGICTIADSRAPGGIASQRFNPKTNVFQWLAVGAQNATRNACVGRKNKIESVA